MKFLLLLSWSGWRLLGAVLILQFLLPSWVHAQAEPFYRGKADSHHHRGHSGGFL